MHRSVCHNDITGEGAEQLAKVVLEHTTLTDFCSLPLASLRSNSVTELNLSGKGIGVPGAIVLAALLPSATALASLKCAALYPRPKCQQPLTLVPFPSRSLQDNYLTNFGQDMAGVQSLAETLKVNSTLTCIKYAAALAFLIWQSVSSR